MNALNITVTGYEGATLKFLVRKTEHKNARLIFNEKFDENGRPMKLDLVITSFLSDIKKRIEQHEYNFELREGQKRYENCEDMPNCYKVNLSDAKFLDRKEIGKARKLTIESAENGHEFNMRFTYNTWVPDMKNRLLKRIAKILG